MFWLFVVLIGTMLFKNIGYINTITTRKSDKYCQGFSFDLGLNILNVLTLVFALKININLDSGDVTLSLPLALLLRFWQQDSAKQVYMIL